MKANAISVVRPGEIPPARGGYVIVVPGQSAPIQKFDLPVGVKGSARRAIARRQLADRVGPAANAVELIPIGGASWDIAIVCDRALLHGWCDAEAAKSRRCQAVLPDMLALPAAENFLVLQSDNKNLVARAGLYDGFSAPLNLAPVMLRKLIDENDLINLNHVDALPDDIRAVVAESGLPFAPLPGTGVQPLVDLRDALHARTAPGQLLWGGAAALALLAFGLWAGSVLIEIRMLNRDVAATRAATTELLREGLIPSGPILDVRQQVNQVIKAQTATGQGENASTVALLSRATVALFGTGVDVGAITLDNAKNGLTIDIVAADFAAVESLLQTFRNAGLGAQAGDLRNRTDGGVTARLMVGMESSQ